MPKRAIVVHYHELWLKGNNRSFFLGKFLLALRRTLAQFPIEKIRQPGDRVVIHLPEGMPAEPVIAALERVMGIAYFGVARVVGRGSSDDLDALCQAAWAEVEPLPFTTFAVRAKRSDKSFPVRTSDIEAKIGRYLLDHLRAAGREVRVKLDEPELTCRIEITPGSHAGLRAQNPGPGGLPANTTGRMLCLLSGGYDSAVAAYKMMRRGAHSSFVHFWGGGASWRILRARGARVGRAARALPIHRQALPGAVRTDSARNRALRAGKLPPAALSPHDVANRRAHRTPGARAGHHRRG